MAMRSLKDAFVGELKDVLSAEKQLVQALPRISNAASNPKLKKAIATHLSETKNQVQRIEQVFESLDLTPRSKKCEGMEGIIGEGKEHLEEDAEPDVMDAMIIASAQKVEHYEIATYGTLCAWAEELGYQKALELLRKNLEEEEHADQTLSEIAESQVNREAVSVEA